MKPFVVEICCQSRPGKDVLFKSSSRPKKTHGDEEKNVQGFVHYCYLTRYSMGHLICTRIMKEKNTLVAQLCVLSDA